MSYAPKASSGVSEVVELLLAELGILDETSEDALEATADERSDEMLEAAVDERSDEMLDTATDDISDDMLALASALDELLLGDVIAVEEAACPLELAGVLLPPPPPPPPQPIRLRNVSTTTARDISPRITWLLGLIRRLPVSRALSIGVAIHLCQK